MKSSTTRLFFIVGFLCMTARTIAQPDNYFDLAATAWQQYEAKDYEKAGTLYTKAYHLGIQKTYMLDAYTSAYNGACSWSLAHKADSAFLLLNEVSTRDPFIQFYEQLLADSDFAFIRSDPRWPLLLETVKAHKAKFEQTLNPLLVTQLADIYAKDQTLRKQALEYEQKFGSQASQTKAKWEETEKQDALNQKTVKAIIDQYGWMGPKEIGYNGSQTLFLVMQHADLKTQEAYLPLLQAAVKAGKAQPQDLALMEDRIALRQGRKQIYGSQLIRDGKTGKMLYPEAMTDPDHVDQRRASAGLEPMKQYLNRNGAEWDIENYKSKILPALEAAEKKQ